jgi:AcrR family transcriptional regulator
MTAAPTQQAIALAALRILEGEGAGAVTMRRVATAVGITAMAIYRHYPNRAALLNAIAEDGFAALAAALRKRRLAGTVMQRLEKMGDLYLDHALENPRLFELMFLQPREGARRYPSDFKARRSPTATEVADLIAEGMRDGTFRDDDAWEIAFEMGALSHGLIALYLGGRIELSRTAFRALYRRSFRRYLNGLRS